MHSIVCCTNTSVVFKKFHPPSLPKLVPPFKNILAYIGIGCTLYNAYQYHDFVGTCSGDTNLSTWDEGVCL